MGAANGDKKLTFTDAASRVRDLAWNAWSRQLLFSIKSIAPTEHAVMRPVHFFEAALLHFGSRANYKRSPRKLLTVFMSRSTTLWCVMFAGTNMVGSDQWLVVGQILSGPRERSPTHKNLAVGESQFETATQVSPGESAMRGPHHGGPALMIARRPQPGKGMQRLETIYSATRPKLYENRLQTTINLDRDAVLLRINATLLKPHHHAVLCCC
ncbi:hypothetical protein Y032_0118g782 [Ancylostoma ceylanicum]|uniref:Uncharacterized protein n=1 Tax=Ancylostoma ceylanicum TaxID=53326 RepID=A0A016TB06_9BILA|nr:hypothetical protein Y032_0118g782 [Ancylostoma ceylanicum]